MSDETKIYRIRGSHKDEYRIRALLGVDPQIHSGGGGKGTFCLYLTACQRQMLINNGIHVPAHPIGGKR